jgi:hypothetical protein
MKLNDLYRSSKRKMTALTISSCLVAIPLNAGVSLAEQPEHEINAAASIFSKAAISVPVDDRQQGAGYTGQVTRVTSLDELKAAMPQVQPGDVIEMANGTWTDADIAFTAAATAAKPVTLRAETPGKVFLDGKSKISINSPYLVVDGLYFKQSIPTNTGTVVSLNSDYGRLTNMVIDNYNPPNTNTRYSWVYIKGKYNTIDHNYFTGKNHSGPLLAQHVESKHNTVSHNYFKDIPFYNENGREIIQVVGYGNSEELGSDGAFMTIEYNLFENADGEGAEIISLKSNHNLVRYNTFRASRGGIVGRSGNNNTIQGNFILGENKEGTSGIRLSGQNHKVINNYVADVAGVGLTLTSGEYYVDKDGKIGYLTPSYQPILRAGTQYGVVPSYGQVKNGLYAFNTFVNNGGADMDIGNWYKNNWPKKQLVLLPENNNISHNISYKKPGSVTSVGASVYGPPQDRNSPLDGFQFTPNQYRGNIVIGGEVNLNTPVGAGGFIEINPKLQLSSDGIYRMAPDSPAAGGFQKNDDELHQLDGRVDGKAEAGGEDFEPSRIGKPLTAADVGPTWAR